MRAPPTSDRSMADYEDVVDPEQWRRLEELGDDLAGTRVLHVNSTAEGGGVAEMLRSVVPLTNDLGVGADWAVVEADDPFFEVTKALHNGLQGDDVPLTEEMLATYRSVTERNAAAVADGYDVIVLHDPQTLGMAEPLAERLPDAALAWRCHIDLTDPAGAYREFVEERIRHVDRVVVSQPEYGRSLDAPVTVIHPSIDPLVEKNRSLDESELRAEFDRLDPIPFDSEPPVITQVSRFDPWKDPLGVVDAYRRLTEEVPDAHLVLAGGMAADDPEGEAVLAQVRAETEDDPNVHLLTNEPDRTVNVLQRASDVVWQKSLREGFGLVVAEALWKRTPVIGSNVGGIPLQIEDGENGYLVDPEDVAAVVESTEALLGDDERRRRLGERGRETVRERFLLPRHLLDYLELFADLR